MNFTIKAVIMVVYGSSMGYLLRDLGPLGTMLATFVLTYMAVLLGQ